MSRVIAIVDVYQYDDVLGEARTFGVRVMSQSMMLRPRASMLVKRSDDYASARRVVRVHVRFKDNALRARQQRARA
ncbi:MAG: hypothetical protein Q8M31_00895 [Beijerinckiaceae bacterium]|nr:hypothetical protein [Beijerinckiaceae bacterium]